MVSMSKNLEIERKIDGKEETVKLELTDEEMKMAYDIQRHNYMLEDVIDVVENYYETEGEIEENEKDDMIEYALEIYEEQGYEYNRWYDCIDDAICDYNRYKYRQSKENNNDFFTSSYEFSKKDFMAVDDDFSDLNRHGSILKIILLFLLI